MREQTWQDEQAAWTNYQATPLYITVEGVDNAAEADKWLVSLQAGKLRSSAKSLPIETNRRLK